MSDHLESLSYEQWGVAFFRRVITQDRIVTPIHALAGERIEFGPKRVGPGRVASVVASGHVGDPVAIRLGDLPLRYRVRLPVDVDFTLDLKVSTHRFSARLDVPLVLTATAAEPLTIFVEVETPSSKDIEIDLRAHDLRTSVVKELADVRGELRRFVAKYVAREVEKPHIRAARTIDVLSLVDGALTAHTSAVTS